MNDFSPNLATYKPSGSFSFPGVILTLLLGLVAAVPLGVVYAYINHHDPILYVNIVLVGGFGICLGWILSKGIHRFAIRSVSVTVVMALLVFVVAYLTHWVAYATAVWTDLDDLGWDFAFNLETFKAFCQHPDALWGFIQDINTHGIWTISSSGSSKGTEVRGVVLGFFWLAEALGILWYTMKLPLQETGKPYSERSEKWLEPKELSLPVAFISDKNAFRSALARNDYSALTTPLPPEAEGEESTNEQRGHAQVTLYSDPFDPCVTVKNVSIKVKKKKTDVTTVEVIRYLRVSPSVAENISKALGGFVHA